MQSVRNMSDLERLSTVLYGFVQFPTVRYDFLRFFFFPYEQGVYLLRSVSKPTRGNKRLLYSRVAYT